MKHFSQKAALLLLMFALLLQGYGGPGFKHVSMDEAAKMMKADKNVVIVDVRTQEEYDSGHIPGAICSEDASALLVKQGYKKVYDFGGLVDWTGEVEGAEVGKK